MELLLRLLRVSTKEIQPDALGFSIRDLTIMYEKIHPYERNVPHLFGLAVFPASHGS